MNKIFLLAGSAVTLTFFNWANAALLDVNFPGLISRADLDYTNPASRSEQGLPVGNGRMGSLVWTTPDALHFQINRSDVFAENSSTVSFPEADSDYASGCGYVDILVASAGDDVFSGKEFHQHLSVYDAVMSARGSGVTTRVLAWPRRDVLAVEVDDERKQPETVNVDLRMLRYAVERVTGRNYELATNHASLIRTAEHTATSRLDIRDGRILLIQEFRETNFYDSSAVAISVAGRKAKARYLNESTVQLSIAPGRERFTVLISSAASFDPGKDVGALATDELQAAEAKGFKTLQGETADWWHDFWRQGFVYLHSPDGQADFVEANYTYFLYLMGASSRGDFPPRFGGMLWRTTGDLSRWGSQYWWANTSAYYSNLLPANRPGLMDPLFKMYSGMFDACTLAAKQQWGSQGIWIPETTFFSGPEKLPDDIAAELQDLMLVRKPFSERSTNFQWFAEVKNRHNSRWNFLADGHWEHGHFVVPTKGGSRGAGDDGEGSEIFGHTTHILGVGSRIASLYWQRYEFSLDTNWLSARAYPMLKGAAEFYRNFPNFQKGDDGIYHIRHVNNGEGQWNSADTEYELTCLHMIFPLAIRASEILGIDDDLRARWREINTNLPPMPARRYRGGGVWKSSATTNQVAGEEVQNETVIATTAPNAVPQRRNRRDGVFGAFVYGGPGAIEPLGPEPELKSRFLGFNRVGSFIDGRGIGGAQIFRNRLRLREGPGAIDAEHLGGLAAGIHSTMLSSEPNQPGGEPVLRIFNGWPKDWDAAFTLLSRGAMIVSSEQCGGKILFVEIKAQAGGQCNLVNPWPGEKITVYRGGQPVDHQSGEVLTFSMADGETVTVAPGELLPAPNPIP